MTTTAFSDLVTEELRQVEAFVALLKTEQSVLTSTDPLALGEITERKNQLVEQLIACAQQRNRWLKLSGFPETTDGLQHYLQTHGSAEESRVFVELKALATEARALNEKNAKLVGLRLQVTHQALAALLPPEQSPVLYDVQGQSAQRIGYKLIDSA